MAASPEAYVPMLYGDYVSSSHAGSLMADGYMIPCRGEIQAALAQEGIGLAVAFATHRPEPGDKVPRVLMAHDPVFDEAGAVTSLSFEAGHALDDRRYPVTFDNHIQNFHGNIPSGDITTPKHAFGIGLPPERVWNHRTIQDLGNDKSAADAILKTEGTGIPSYAISEYDKLVDEQNTQRIIYKPNMGALAKGVQPFDTYAEYQAALQAGELAADGHIQPRYDVHKRIEGLVGATEEDKRLLARFNVDAPQKRPRELRMHIIASPGSIEAFPILKVGEAGTDVMKTAMMIGLDPSCVPEGSYIHQRSIRLGQASLAAASLRNGEPGSVKQAYMCADWLAPRGSIEAAADPRIVDANYRCPGLAVKAYAARQALARGLAQSVRVQLAQGQ